MCLHTHSSSHRSSSRDRLLVLPRMAAVSDHLSPTHQHAKLQQQGRQHCFKEAGAAARAVQEAPSVRQVAAVTVTVTAVSLVVTNHVAHPFTSTSGEGRGAHSLSE